MPEVLGEDVSDPPTLTIPPDLDATPEHTGERLRGKLCPVLDKAAHRKGAKFQPPGPVRSSAFIQGCQTLGFERLPVGIRCNRTLADGRQLSQLKQRGEQVTLHDLQPLWLSWCDVRREQGKKRFYVASTFAAGGAYLAHRYRRRWLIESFFKSIKHDSSCPLGIGLKEARLRTQTGIRLWIFLACLAYSFARHLSQQTLTLPEAAAHVFDALLDIRLLHLMIDCERFSRRSLQRLKLVAA